MRSVLSLLRLRVLFIGVRELPLTAAITHYTSWRRLSVPVIFSSQSRLYMYTDYRLPIPLTIAYLPETSISAGET